MQLHHASAGLQDKEEEEKKTTALQQKVKDSLEKNNLTSHCNDQSHNCSQTGWLSGELETESMKQTYSPSSHTPLNLALLTATPDLECSLSLCIHWVSTCRVGPSPGAISPEGKRSTNARTASILWIASCSPSNLLCSARDSWLRDTTMSFSCCRRLADYRRW